ncbi:hypothetical protein BH11PSE4_BH11PSE4_13600 [soil metagenome]
MKKTLNALFKEIVHEAENNPAFRKRLETALGFDQKSKTKSVATPHDATSAQPKRPSNRRAPALLDPVHLAKQGDNVLRAELERLDIEQLRDVVAEYGMDTGKLVTKWRSADRIVDRIVEVARQRAQKGSAFRDPAPTDGVTEEPTTEPNTPTDNAPPET